MQLVDIRRSSDSEFVMRSLLLTFITVMTLGAAQPAGAQWAPAWTGAGPTFLPGQPYTLMFNQPGVLNFLSLDGPGGGAIEAAELTLTPGIFESISIVPGSLESFLDVFPIGLVATGTNPIYLSVTPKSPGVDGTDLPQGSLFGVEFTVKSVGTGNLSLAYRLVQQDLTDTMKTVVSPSELNPPATAAMQIVAIPEPETWAMMLAGLVLVGAAAARARKQA